MSWPLSAADRTAGGTVERGGSVARGGSWADRPADAGSSVRRAYEPWQKVDDVGFRVVVEDAADPESSSL
jgi:formylglycine-generating enzyme required for sulfatase activity